MNKHLFWSVLLATVCESNKENSNTDYMTISFLPELKNLVYFNKMIVFNLPKSRENPMEPCNVAIGILISSSSMCEFISCVFFI